MQKILIVYIRERREKSVIIQYTTTIIIMKVNILKNKYNFLRDVSELSKTERKLYINEVSDRNIHAICEAVHNILKGSCQMKKLKKKCSKHFKKCEKDMKKIANPKFNIEKKRKILTSAQSGDGMFNLISEVVLPILLNLIRKK